MGSLHLVNILRHLCGSVQQSNGQLDRDDEGQLTLGGKLLLTLGLIFACQRLIAQSLQNPTKKKIE